ncbi:MAG: DUF2157 domain-containing protein [Bacilli bacterium]
MEIIKKIEEWKQHGLLDESTAATLIDYEKRTEMTHTPLSTTRSILFGIAFALIGFSVIFFFASNWQNMTLLTKMTTGLLLFLSSAVVLFLGFKKNCPKLQMYGSILWHVAFAVELIVTSQVYTFPSTSILGFALWMFSGYCIALLFTNQSLLVLSTLVGTCIALYLPFIFYWTIDGNIVLLSIFCIQLALGFYTYYRKNSILSQVLFVPFVLIHGILISATLLPGEQLLHIVTFIILLLPFVTPYALRWSKVFILLNFFYPPLSILLVMSAKSSSMLMPIVFLISHLGFLYYLYTKTNWKENMPFALLTVGSFVQYLIGGDSFSAISTLLTFFVILTFCIWYAAIRMHLPRRQDKIKAILVLLLAFLYVFLQFTIGFLTKAFICFVLGTIMIVLLQRKKGGENIEK